jgi:hypothetical protein
MVIIQMMDANNIRLLVETIVVTVGLSLLGAWSFYSVILSRRNSPGMVTRLMKLSNEMSERIEVLERKDQQNYQMILDLQSELTIERQYNRKIYDYSQLLANMLRQFIEDVPAAPEPPAKPRGELEPDERGLHRKMVGLFNIDELDDLAFRLDINHEEIKGTTVSTRARALIQHAKRIGRLPELVKTARQLRPEGEI